MQQNKQKKAPFFFIIIIIFINKTEKKNPHTFEAGIRQCLIFLIDKWLNDQTLD